MKPPGPATYPTGEPAKPVIHSNGRPSTRAGHAADTTGTGYANKQGSGGPAAATREATSQQLLRMSWDYGYAPRTMWQDQTLPASVSLATLAGGDPRPLLVLRGCEACAGTEDAFLSREFDNEKTILLGRWFHAVKLTAEVLDEKHPYHALFAGTHPAHLFVCTLDGKSRIDMDGAQSQAKLWSAMLGVLGQSGRKAPEADLASMRRLLDRLDEADRRLVDL